MAAVLARGPSPSQNKSSQSGLKFGRYQRFAQAWQRSQRVVQTMKLHAATDQSPAGPTGFARRRSAPAPAPSNLTQHTSLVAQHPVTLRALSLTAGPLLESLPGAKTISFYYSRPLTRVLD
jgi:hypothetical protein